MKANHLEPYEDQALDLIAKGYRSLLQKRNDERKKFGGALAPKSNRR